MGCNSATHTLPMSALIALATTALLSLTPAVALADKQEEHTKDFDAPSWGVSLRAGAAFFSEDLDTSRPGPTINAQIFYNMGGPRHQMGHNWNMGVHFSYEHHELKDTKAEFVSGTFMPFVEFGTRHDHWRPYTSLGIGMNFSAVKHEPAGVEVDVRNSLAFRMGIGSDFFITDHVALNIEGAWKLNDPSIKSNVSTNGFAPGAPSGNNASAVQLLTGIRFMF